MDPVGRKCETGHHHCPSTPRAASTICGMSGSDRDPAVITALRLTCRSLSEPPVMPFPCNGNMYPRRHVPSQLKAILPQSAAPNNNACGSRGAARNCRKGGGSLLTGRENSRDWGWT